MKEIRINGVSTLFVPYSGDCCVKCYWADNIKVCRLALCRPDEREDGQRGYFRAANVKKIEYSEQIIGK
ncbi:MAG: hypothetical protein PHQ33_05555 [Bacteroidales bacterium]|nr:hypothetical protein [Bacteroidales bacterium]